SSRRRHTIFKCDWSSDVCSSDLDGHRWSIARAYLDSARKRSNLSVVPNALVDSIIFDGAKACGARYVDASGRIQTVSAREATIQIGRASCRERWGITVMGE